MNSIGIDIGTTSICLVVYDGESGRIKDSKSAQNAFLPGSFCQDPDRIVSVCVSLLEELAASNGPVSAIGISAQMHGILYTNAQGRAVSPFYTWKNESGNLPFEGGTYAEVLSARTGYRIYSGYGSATHFYLGKTGQIPKEAVFLCNIGDYLAMRLCERTHPCQDVSIAASIGGLLPDQGDYDRKALEAAGAASGLYPEVSCCFAPLGTWKGIWVYPAVGDNQASFYAAAGREKEAVSVNVGTGSQVSLFSFDPVETSCGEIRPFPGGGSLYVQASLNGGKVYERLAAFWEEAVSAFTGQTIDAYEGMARLGRRTPDTALKVEPLLYGGRGREEVQGSISGITQEDFHPGDLVRAWVAGMARELHQLYLEFPENLRRGRKWIAGSGNGLRKNDLLRQEVEKAFGMPVVLTKIREEAAAGAAMLALGAQTSERRDGAAR